MRKRNPVLPSPDQFKKTKQDETRTFPSAPFYAWKQPRGRDTQEKSLWGLFFGFVRFFISAC